MTGSVTQAAEQAQPSGTTGETGWQTPDYQVVETALEVTAYALSSR
ncbi:pyrroloquinoline quinone precursor peptide PqqA [Streptomyces sp. NPDC004647]